MALEKIHRIHFSPTGTTRTVVEAIAEEFEGEHVTWDMLRDVPETETEFGPNELVIAGMPVYAGRIPGLCGAMLSKFRGRGTPTIATVVYGNRDYDDALLELKNVMEAGGFSVAGAGAFVAQHSIFPLVGAGRPDTKDLGTIADFARKCAYKIETAPAENLASPEVKGNFPYKQPGSIPLAPSGNEKCNRCGACVALCPTRAIEASDPRRTDVSRCISCAACIAICPQKARAFRGFKYWLGGRAFRKKFTRRMEPEVFV